MTIASENQGQVPSLVSCQTPTQWTRCGRGLLTAAVRPKNGGLLVPFAAQPGQISTKTECAAHNYANRDGKEPFDYPRRCTVQ